MCVLLKKTIICEDKKKMKTMLKLTLIYIYINKKTGTFYIFAFCEIWPHDHGG